MDSIQQAILEMKTLFNTQMEVFEGDLSKATETSTKAPTTPVTLDKLSTEFTQFKMFIFNALELLQHQVALLTQECDNLEMRSRRNMLLIHGLPEKQNEVCDQLVCNTLSQKTHMPDLKTSDFTQCYRLGAEREGKPRPVLLKFYCVAIRDKVWFAKKALKGSGITLSEFLTRRRHAVFVAARQHYGIPKCWTKEGMIFVLGQDGKKRQVTSTDDFEPVTNETSKPASSQPVGNPVKPIFPEKQTRAKRNGAKK